MIKSRPNVRVPSQSNPVPTCPVPPEREKTGQPRSISPAAIRSSDLPWCLRVFVGKKSVLRDRMNSTEAVPSPVPVPSSMFPSTVRVPSPPFVSRPIPSRLCPVPGPRRSRTGADTNEPPPKRSVHAPRGGPNPGAAAGHTHRCRPSGSIWCGATARPTSILPRAVLTQDQLVASCLPFGIALTSSALRVSGSDRRLALPNRD
jgi:hypothetical protein